MPDVLIEDELKELLAKCENIVPEENYVVDECTKERDKEFELAKKDGYIIFDETKYRIDSQDVLVIDGNINRLYGNVFYDRTVRVNGNIGEGAIISAKGDVIVTGYVQSSYISSGNKVVAIGGINANDSGYICAQSGVYAGYAAATTRNMTEADIPMV